MDGGREKGKDTIETYKKWSNGKHHLASLFFFQFSNP